MCLFPASFMSSWSSPTSGGNYIIMYGLVFFDCERYPVSLGHKRLVEPKDWEVGRFQVQLKPGVENQKEQPISCSAWLLTAAAYYNLSFSKLERHWPDSQSTVCTPGTRLTLIGVLVLKKCVEGRTCQANKTSVQYTCQHWRAVRCRRHNGRSGTERCCTPAKCKLGPRSSLFAVSVSHRMWSMEVIRSKRGSSYRGLKDRESLPVPYLNEQQAQERLVSSLVFEGPLGDVQYAV